MGLKHRKKGRMLRRGVKEEGVAAVVVVEGEIGGQWTEASP